MYGDAMWPMTNDYRLCSRCFTIQTESRNNEDEDEDEDERE